MAKDSHKELSFVCLFSTFLSICQSNTRCPDTVVIGHKDSLVSVDTQMDAASNVLPEINHFMEQPIFQLITLALLQQL